MTLKELKDDSFESKFKSFGRVSKIDKLED